MTVAQRSVANAVRTIFDTSDVAGVVLNAAAAIDPRHEVAETLHELIESFGETAVTEALEEMAVSNPLHERERAGRALRMFARIILEAKHPKFTAQLVFKAARGDFGGNGGHRDLAQLARTVGVSKQAASKRLASICEELGLPRSESTAAARLSHRLLNKRNYGRKLNRTA